jgi:hypothetical protein
MLEIPASVRQGLKNHELKANQGFIERPSLKKKSKGKS